MPAAKTALILGAGSDIARELARLLAAKGWSLQLAARQPAGLAAFKSELEQAHKAPVGLYRFDVLEGERHAAFLEELPLLPDLAVMAVGLLGAQDRSEKDLAAASQVIRSNYEGPALILGEIANRFAARGSGTIVGISSVAGERGRKANYVYGAAKAGFTAFLSGLRQRLSKKGVHVMTVLPGFVDTKMVRHKNHPKILTARPITAARAIVKGIEKKRNVIYVLGIRRLIMTIIRLMPERLFEKDEPLMPKIGDARLLPQFLSIEEQRALLRDIQAVLASAPPFRPVMPKDGRPFSVRMSNCGPLGWVSDRAGYRYQAKHPQSGEPWPAMPQALLGLWQEVTGYPHLPQACLINLYDEKARMGLHRDADEADKQAPVLSISLGDGAHFRLGGPSRQGPTQSFKLQSGDILVLEGAARHAYHGIDKIYPGTSRLVPGGGRINLTLRRVTLP